MIEAIYHSFKSKQAHVYFIFLACVFFLFFRLFILTSIAVERQLPVEVDDSLVYSLTSQTIFEDPFRKNITSTTAMQNSLPNVSEDSAERYFAHAWSKSVADHLFYGVILKWISKILNLEPLFSIVVLSFILQPLQLFSFYYFIRNVFQLSNFQTSISIVFFAFSIFANIHILTGTPFSFSVCMGLLAMGLLSKSRIVLSILLFLMSLLMHVGGVIGIAMFMIAMSNKKLIQVFTENKSISLSFRKVKLFLIEISKGEALWVPVFSCLLVFGVNTIILKIWGFGPLMLGVALDQSKNLLTTSDNFVLNLIASVKIIYFSLRELGPPLIILAFILSINFVKNTFNIINLFLVAWVLIWFVSLFHVLPYHPGGLTKYSVQYLSIFICAALGSLSGRYLRNE